MTGGEREIGYFLASLSPQIPQDSFEPLGYSWRRVEFSADMLAVIEVKRILVFVGLVEERCRYCRWRDEPEFPAFFKWVVRHIRPWKAWGLCTKSSGENIGLYSLESGGERLNTGSPWSLVGTMSSAFHSCGSAGPYDIAAANASIVCMIYR